MSSEIHHWCENCETLARERNEALEQRNQAMREMEDARNHAGREILAARRERDEARAAVTDFVQLSDSFVSLQNAHARAEQDAARLAEALRQAHGEPEDCTNSCPMRAALSAHEERVRGGRK